MTESLILDFRLKPLSETQLSTIVIIAKKLSDTKYKLLSKGHFSVVLFCYMTYVHVLCSQLIFFHSNILSKVRNAKLILIFM